MPINKLEQLRKYIFDIEIERIQFEQVSTQKGKIVGIDKILSIQNVSRGNPPFIWFFDRKKSQKRYVAAVLKGLRIAEVMSKPNDSKQR